MRNVWFCNIVILIESENCSSRIWTHTSAMCWSTCTVHQTTSLSKLALKKVRGLKKYTVRRPRHPSYRSRWATSTVLTVSFQAWAVDWQRQKQTDRPGERDYCGIDDSRMLSLPSSMSACCCWSVQCVHLRTLSASLSPSPSKHPLIRAAGRPAVFEACSSTAAARHSRGDSGIPQKITRQTHTTWTRRICSVFSSLFPPRVIAQCSPSHLSVLSLTYHHSFIFSFSPCDCSTTFQNKERDASRIFSIDPQVSWRSDLFQAQKHWPWQVWQQLNKLDSFCHNSKLNISLICVLASQQKLRPKIKVRLYVNTGHWMLMFTFILAV